MLKRTFAMLMSAGLVLTAGAAPSFTLKQLNGSTFKLAEHVGKQVIVVDFWATWCAPCTKYLKKLQELKVNYPDVLVLAVSIDDGQSMSQVSQYVQGRGFTFTVLLDPDTNILKMFNPTGGVPTTVVIDKKGEIVFSHTGYLPGDERTLAAKVEELRK